ncbi:60S Ribosomal Protein L12 [Manis pentadactyla]|nr:60S Ribosomal Protein L12 [Manis pentadactyla]
MEVAPSASALIIKALKELPRDRKKQKNRRNEDRILRPMIQKPPLLEQRDAKILSLQSQLLQKREGLAAELDASGAEDLSTADQA